MARYKKINFRIPDCIIHDDAKKVIADIVKQLNKNEILEAADIPQLHRMSVAYDTYLTCVDILALEGLTMKNLKGEIVKRPEANLLKESWSQYLELAKEYGLTVKSKGQIKVLNNEDAGESPLRTFLRENREIR
nr:MAG TPA: terminase small subunit [Caudoviricetes sp.]